MLANTIGKLDFHSWSIISVCVFTLLSILAASALKEEKVDTEEGRNARSSTKLLFDLICFLVILAGMLYLSAKKGAIVRGFELSARLGYSVSEIIAWILLGIMYGRGASLYNSKAPISACIVLHIVVGVVILALLLVDFYVLEPKLVAYLEQFFGPAHTTIFTPSTAGANW